MSIETNINIVQYNVLSSSLATGDYFFYCNPNFLDKNYRLPLLQQRLLAEVNKKSIICLQEISILWAAKLNVFFNQHDYYLITGMYGNRNNGYMGVGIAFPRNSYRLLDSTIEAISNTKRRDTVKITETLSAYHPWRILKSFFILPLYKMYTKYFLPPPDMTWQDAMNRHNQMVCLRLQPSECNEDSNKSFVVGTYHMPCMFDRVPIMVIHTALSTQFVQRWAGEETPCIYCGDFNMKSDSPMYSLVTSGKLAKTSPSYPPLFFPTDTWRVDVKSMKSVYKSFQGHEPEYTICSRIKDKEEFVDTLDYIFLSGKHDWKIKSILKLPKKKEGVAKGYMPTEEEPSDHMMLGAELTLTF